MATFFTAFLLGFIIGAYLTHVGYKKRIMEGQPIEADGKIYESQCVRGGSPESVS